MKRSEIEQFLPGVFQRTLHKGNLLVALLAVMEDLHAPAEAILERLDSVFDPRRTRDDFVPFLAQWVDLMRVFDFGASQAIASGQLREPISTGLGNLRELIANAAYLSQWRGTGKGLLRFLQIATGVEEFEIDDQLRTSAGQIQPFHIRVRAPESTKPHQALIERIIDLEKPAYVTYELEFIAGHEG